MKKRIDYIDTAKGISIIAVVLSHALSNSNSGLTVDHPVLLNWLSFFNVSTFFFINGFLYNESCSEKPFKSIIKKFKTYYIPYISYNIFFMLFHNPFVKMHILEDNNGLYSIKDYFVSFIKVILGKMQPLTGPMWFLRALILLSIMYICVDAISSRIFNGKFRYIINGVTAIILLLVSKLTFIPTTFNFPAACGAFILYYFGVMYRRYELNNLLNKKLVPISIITFFISALIGNTFMVGISGSINPLMDFISMLVSLIMVLAVSQIRPISNISILKFFGKCSLEIMALHMFSFKAISLIMIKFYGYDISLLSDIPVIRLSNLSLLWYILYTVAGLFLPAAFYLVKAKVKSKISH